MKHLKFLDQADIRQSCHPREGETKFGQVIALVEDFNTLSKLESRFVLIGIMEDIGIRANHGRPGAASTFKQFLKPLLNIQVNRFWSKDSLALGPYLDFSDWQEVADTLDAGNPQDLKQLRELCAKIDEELSQLALEIFKAGKIPLVIGGGHNNSYGLIKAAAKHFGEAVNVLNIDPHADFRALEGRHSGNGFSYAKAENLLNRYAVYGLHESYNNQQILEDFRASADLYYLSYDQLLAFSTDERDRMFKDALRWLGPGPIGLELDLDSIEAFPASALNASGFNLQQARLMIKTASALAHPFYLHLAEAAPDLSEDTAKQEMSLKALVYLITDFVKSFPE